MRGEEEDMLRFADPPDLRWGGRKQQRGSPEPETGKVRKESTQGPAEPCGEKGEIHRRGTARSEAGEPWALRRRSRTKFACGPGQSAAQVILGIGMTAGKARTGDPEDGVDLARRNAGWSGVRRRESEGRAATERSVSWRWAAWISASP